MRRERAVGVRWWVDDASACPHTYPDGVELHLSIPSVWLVTSSSGDQSLRPGRRAGLNSVVSCYRENGVTSSTPGWNPLPGSPWHSAPPTWVNKPPNAESDRPERVGTPSTGRVHRTLAVSSRTARGLWFLYF